MELLPEFRLPHEVDVLCCAQHALTRGRICRMAGRMIQTRKSPSLESHIGTDSRGRSKHALFVGIDANFRLKRRAISSEEKDPSLSEGWAFFVEETAYKAHLTKHWNQPQEVSVGLFTLASKLYSTFEQRSTCVDHDAVNKPDKESRGNASSGVGAVDCIRHNMKRPQGVGDLQKGERSVF